MNPTAMVMVPAMVILHCHGDGDGNGLGPWHLVYGPWNLTKLSAIFDGSSPMPDHIPLTQIIRWSWSRSCYMVMVMVRFMAT